MSRSQRPVLRLPRVGMEGSRSHSISRRVWWVPRRRGGRWVLGLRVTGVGGWWRANRGRQRGFWDIRGSMEPSHAGFVRRMKTRWVVGTCWRRGGTKRREHSFGLSRDNNKKNKKINVFFNSSFYLKMDSQVG